MDSEMKTFVHSALNADFSMSLDDVVSHCDNTTGSFSRFQSICSGDTAYIKQVLQAVQDAGMSPAFFASYEANEGYNPSWGWLNYTTPQGNPVQDAAFVARHMVEVSQNMENQPSWIDAGNPVDFVPQNIKDEGNADFASMPSGTVGRSYIPSTAAATWEVYYPQGLQAAYNGIQNYGSPLASCIKVIKSWGGKISGGSEPPTKPDKPADSKPSDTPENKPAVNTAPTKPVYHGAFMSHELGNSNHGFTNLNFEFFNNKKKSEKPSNDTNASDENHNEDVDNGNQDKPTPSNPNPNLDLAWLDSIQGTFVGGSDQCYGLASAWAMHNGTPQLIGGSRQPGIEVAEPGIAVSMAAANIGCDYPWDSWGWDVILHPTREQIKAGDICCMVCDDPRGWIPSVDGVRYGHVCIAGTDSGGVFSLWEQNGTYRGGTAKQPATSGKPTLDTYMPYIFYAIRKR